MKKIKAALFAILTTIAFYIKLSQLNEDVVLSDFEKIYSIIPKIAEILRSVDAGYPISILCLVMILILYYKLILANVPYKVSRNILAIIASIFFVAGRIFYVESGFDTTVVGINIIFKITLVLIGYGIFFYYALIGIELIYTSALDKIRNIKETDKKYHIVLWAVFFMIAWLPYLYIYYPAIFMGDTENMLYMAFNYKTGLEDTVNLINSSIYITNHHPVVYTLIMGAFVRTARFIGASDNFGMFLLAAVQYM